MIALRCELGKGQRDSSPRTPGATSLRGFEPAPAKNG